MPDGIHLTLSFLLACGTTLLLAPLAIRVAIATRFFDRPVGYKGHGRPTPYLGGCAVIGGWLPASLLFGPTASKLAPIVAGTVALLVVGTVDDRHGLGAAPRLAVEVAAGVALFAAGIGWAVFPNDVLNLAFSTVFVVGVVNAFNLMDNMDGAAAALACTSAIGLGILAATGGDAALGAMSLALAGACAGFLPFNLSRPSRIFLGDGGSMPIGFLLAASIMALPNSHRLGWTLIPVTAVMVGLPALDTGLVIASRLRRGAGVFSGARDHLTHRLHGKLGSERLVVGLLVAAQAGLVAGAAVLLRLGE